MKNIEYIIFLAKAILSIIGFLAFFIGLLASPIIYINLKQRHYFKKLQTKYHLKLKPPKHYIIRDFPYVSGKINNQNVFIEATTLGQSYYNIHFNIYKFSSPVIIVGFEFNNQDIEKIALTQKDLCTSKDISDFDKYFTIEVKPEKFKSKVFNNITKQSIMDYSHKSQTYVNLFLDKGYLLSVSNFELTTDKKYKMIIDKMGLVLSITNDI